MDKTKGLITIIVVIISVVITIFLANKLLDTTGKVNQGNYRISDIIVQSSADVKEVQDNSVKIEQLSGLIFDVSQTNTISILIEANTPASSMMIDNLVVTDPVLKGKMNITQEDYDKYEITPDLKSIPLHLEEKEGKYIITLLVDNDNVITNRSVDSNESEIKYDATIFKLWNIPVTDLQFNISFDLIITDDAGNTVKTNINLKMPTDDALESGMSILRQDASKYIFTIQK